MSSEEVQIVLAKRVVSKFSILVPTGMLENPPQVTVVVVLYFPYLDKSIINGYILSVSHPSHQFWAHRKKAQRPAKAKEGRLRRLIQFQFWAKENSSQPSSTNFYQLGSHLRSPFITFPSASDSMAAHVCLMTMNIKTQN